MINLPRVSDTREIIAEFTYETFGDRGFGAAPSAHVRRGLTFSVGPSTSPRYY